MQVKQFIPNKKPDNRGLPTYSPLFNCSLDKNKIKTIKLKEYLYFPQKKKKKETSDDAKNKTQKSHNNNSQI